MSKGCPELAPLLTSSGIQGEHAAPLLGSTVELALAGIQESQLALRQGEQESWPHPLQTLFLFYIMQSKVLVWAGLWETLPVKRSI